LIYTAAQSILGCQFYNILNLQVYQSIATTMWGLSSNRRITDVMANTTPKEESYSTWTKIYCTKLGLRSYSHKCHSFLFELRRTRNPTGPNFWNKLNQFMHIVRVKSHIILPDGTLVLKKVEFFSLDHILRPFSKISS